MSTKSQALAKIEQEYKAYAGDRYGNVMKLYVSDTLKCFIEQSEEFAQAVLDGGTFTACMESVCKGIKQAISDLDVAKRAAAFYFPGCVIEMKMQIFMSAYEAETEDNDTPDSSIVLNLEDFL